MALPYPSSNFTDNRARHLATFPELNPNPVLEVDLAGEVTYANPACRLILEALALDPAQVSRFLPADLRQILRDWDTKTARSVDREICIEDRYYGETVTLIPQLQVTRIYGHDITERKRAEAGLRESEERYRSLADNVPCVLMRFDRDLRAVYLNARSD